MTFTLTQKSTAFASPATLPAGSTQGSLLVLAIFDTPGVGAPTYTLPQGWVHIPGADADSAGGTGQATQIWCYPGNPGGISSVSITGGSTPAGYILEFSAGTGVTGLPDASGSVTGGNLNSVSIVTSAALAGLNEVAVAICFTNYTSATKCTLTAGTGFTNAIAVNQGLKTTTHEAVDYQLDSGTGLFTVNDDEVFSVASGNTVGSIATFYAGTIIPVSQAVPVPQPARKAIPASRLITALATPGGPVFVSDSDACIATDAGEQIRLSSSDACIATDAGEQIRLSSSDAGTAADAGEGIRLTGVTDAAIAADAGEHINATLSSSDAARATDAGEQIGLSSSDAARATDAGEGIRLSSSDAAVAVDAGEHITATLSSSDAAIATDAGEQIRLSSSDAGTALDAGEGIRLSSSDVSIATDAGEGIRLSSSDAARALDAAEQIHVSDTDAGLASDSNGLVTQTVHDSDACVAADAGEQIRLSSSDAGTALDAGEQIHVSSSDASTATDAGEGLKLSSSDAAQALDAGEGIRLSSSDTAIATDAGEHIAATTGSSDAAIAVDAGEGIRLASSDAAIASDAGEGIRLSSSDAGTASDAGEQIHVSSSDAGTATETSTFITAHLSDTDFCIAADGGENVNTGTHTVHDTDTVTCTDSGFFFITDSDACVASDGNTTVTQFVHDSDACAAADGAEHIAGTFLKSDTDFCTATETSAFFTGTLFLSDTDACRAADSQPPMNRAFSDTDACTALDDEHETVHVYAYQPLFRWTGGGFALPWRALRADGTEEVITVWRGAGPDAELYRLGTILEAAAEVRHVHDGDACRAADEAPPPEFGVSASHRRALDLRTGVHIMGP